MQEPKLGRLERVDLRAAWQNEASGFTPWLAQESNLALLGETIGMELEHEATERSVGPFRADILCKDTATDQWVLIENQLERTDHNHLGQLMTYAAGLNAVTIVWLAARFTDEHRAALDWLNEITDERFRFFGLEIELWRIGGSSPAPKFNVVSSPNDWTRSVAAGARRAELSETQQLQVEYWGAFAEHLRANGSFLAPTRPLPQNWYTFAIGRSYFHLNAVINTRTETVSVMLILTGPDAKPHYHLLAEQREAIERELEEVLDWRERPDHKESHIVVERPESDPTNRSHWPEQFAWLQQKLEKIHTAFSPRIRALDASTYQ